MIQSQDSDKQAVDRDASAGEDVPAHEEINAIGPGGLTADHDIGIIESGQPAGGPSDLAKRAHDQAE